MKFTIVATAAQALGLPLPLCAPKLFVVSDCDHSKFLGFLWPSTANTGCAFGPSFRVFLLSSRNTIENPCHHLICQWLDRWVKVSLWKTQGLFFFGVFMAWSQSKEKEKGHRQMMTFWLLRFSKEKEKKWELEEEEERKRKKWRMWKKVAIFDRENSAQFLFENLICFFPNKMKIPKKSSQILKKNKSSAIVFKRTRPKTFTNYLKKFHQINITDSTSLYFLQDLSNTINTILLCTVSFKLARLSKVGIAAFIFMKYSKWTQCEREAVFRNGGGRFGPTGKLHTYSAHACSPVVFLIFYGLLYKRNGIRICPCVFVSDLVKRENNKPLPELDFLESHQIWTFQSFHIMSKLILPRVEGLQELFLVLNLK